MRVIMVSHMWASPGDELHGIYVEDLVNAIVAEGVDIRVIAPVPYTPSFFAGRNAKWAGYRSVAQSPPFPERARPVFLQFPAEIGLKTYPLRFSFAINRVLKDWCKQGWVPDLFHAQTAAQAGISLVRHRPEPVVITTHGRDVHDLWFMGKAVQKNISEAYARAEARVWPSDNLIQEAVDVGAMARDGRDSVIYNGIGTVPDLSSGVSENGVRVGIVSRLIEGKGIHVLLDAMGQLVKEGRTVSLQAVGDGPVREQLEAQAVLLGVPVTWHGQVLTPEAYKKLQGCNMFVLPSFAEGFGMAYFEAMKAGLPVIGTVDTGFAELVRNGDNAQLVVQNNPEALAQAIRNLADNQAERLRMAAAGQALVGDEYSWRSAARQHIAVYQKVMRK